MSDKNIVISTRAILITLLILSVFWVLWLIKGVIIALFLSIILALALEPAVRWLVSRKIPHGLAVFLIVFVFIVVMVVLASFSVTPLISQTQVLFQKFPLYIESLFSVPGTEEYAKKFNNALFEQLSQTSGTVVAATIGAFSSAISFIVILVFTVYLLLDFDSIRDWALSFSPKDDRKGLKELLSTIELQLGNWLRGQALLMVIIGFATFVGLTILGIDYALALAVFAGFLEIVPIIGPIISVIPAAIIGFSISPIMGFAVIGLYILIQQFENNVIVPKVMQRAVGFNPLVTIVVLLVGAKLFGLIGAIIAIPATIVFFEIAKYLLHLDIPYFSRLSSNKDKSSTFKKLNIFK